tara:strand:+ start:336 stop:587 length:252 start_codon:yes stop_codon:yes gene_type:complete
MHTAVQIGMLHAKHTLNNSVTDLLARMFQHKDLSHNVKCVHSIEIDKVLQENTHLNEDQDHHTGVSSEVVSTKCTYAPDWLPA